MATPFNTTVNNLIINFRQTLNALVPSMQTARILDDNLVGYDDWARICDTLYSIMVIEPIRSSLDSSRQIDFDLPCYNTEYESYEHFSLIRVSQQVDTVSIKMPVDTAFLHSFVSSKESNSQFALTETIRIDNKFRLIDDSFEVHEQSYFTCIIPDGDQWNVLDEITARLD